MSILEWQVNSVSNFASFFIVITHSSPLSLKLRNFLLCIKGSNESPNFENSAQSRENLLNPSCHYNHNSHFLQILHHTLVEMQLLCTFQPKNFIFCLIAVHKCKFLRLFSFQVKIRQISYVSFETMSQFLFIFLIILQCHYL